MFRRLFCKFKFQTLFETIPIVCTATSKSNWPGSFRVYDFEYGWRTLKTRRVCKLRLLSSAKRFIHLTESFSQLSVSPRISALWPTVITNLAGTSLWPVFVCETVPKVWEWEIGLCWRNLFVVSMGRNIIEKCLCLVRLHWYVYWCVYIRENLCAWSVWWAVSSVLPISQKKIGQHLSPWQKLIIQSSTACIAFFIPSPTLTSCVIV